MGGIVDCIILLVEYFGEIYFRVIGWVRSSLSFIKILILVWMV